MASFSNQSFSVYDRSYRDALSKSRLCKENLSEGAVQAFDPIECRVRFRDRFAGIFSGLAQQELATKFDQLSAIRNTYSLQLPSEERTCLNRNVNLLERLLQNSQQVVLQSSQQSAEAGGGFSLVLRSSQNTGTSIVERAKLTPAEQRLRLEVEEKRTRAIWSLQIEGLDSCTALELELALLTLKSLPQTIGITEDKKLKFNVTARQADNGEVVALLYLQDGYLFRTYLPYHCGATLFKNGVPAAGFREIRNDFELDNSGKNEFVYYRLYGSDYIPEELFSIKIKLNDFWQEAPRAQPQAQSKPQEDMSASSKSSTVDYSCLANIGVVKFLKDNEIVNPQANDPYSILGLKPDATKQEVRKAYLVLVKKVHSDKNGNDPSVLAIAEATSKLVISCYEEIVKR